MDSKQNGIALRWGDPPPPAIELGLVKPTAPGIAALEKVIVSLHLNFPREVELNRICHSIPGFQRGNLSVCQPVQAGNFSENRL